MRIALRRASTTGALALVLAACSGEVSSVASGSTSSAAASSGAGSSSGGGSPSGSSSSGAGGAPFALGAIAVPGAQASWMQIAFGGGTPTGVFDPTALYLVVGGPAIPTCAVPMPHPDFGPPPPPGQADVSIQVPAAEQQPGTLQLQARAVPYATYAFEICAGAPCNPTTPPYPGAITITAIDAAHVAFTAKGTQAYQPHSWDNAMPGIDGTYSAVRCP
jgi:hypothetical protein